MKRAFAALGIVVILAVNLGAADKPQPQSPDGGSVAAAAVSNLFFIPGKTGTCVLSGVLWTAIMSLTGGTFYQEAGDLVHNACTGKWVLRGTDFASKE